MQTFQPKLLTRFVIGAYGLLSASVMASESQFVADPTAGAQFQPSFSTSANQGIQVINIVAPSAAGISHNKFDTFNVGEEGVIHNNSTTGNETSVLDGGSIGANINFSGQSASTIIDEVTTSNTSSIEGAIEVYGDSAGLIIANPNGISCNGCSFINAPNSALTTGAVSYDQAGNIQFDTSGNANAVSIGSDGLDANGNFGTNNSNFSVISRQILLDGAVEGSDRVDIISGSNVYDFTQGSQDANGPNGSITKKAGTGGVNGLQIDASNVSSVQAGKINIVGTESGVGVQLNGSLDATAGNIEIDSDGNLVIGGSVSASESVRATTGNSADITNRGSVTGRIAVEIDSDGAFDNSATGSITGTSVTIETDQNATNAGSIQSTSRTASFVATNETDRVAEIAVGLADAIAQMAGVTSVRASDGLILIEVSDAVASDPNFPLVAEVELPDGTVKQFPLTKDGGAYTIDLRQTVAESGLPSDNAAFSPVAGAQYRLRSTGDLSVAARSLNNSGTLSSEGDVDVAVNASITNSGRIASGVDINLSANSVTNSGEQGIVAGQDINIDLDGYQTSLTNEGLIGAGRDLQIGTDGDRIYSVTNRGNRALLAAGRDATVFSDTIENTGQAAIYSGGDLGLAASQSIRNLDGSLIEGRNVNLETLGILGRIENSESTIYSVADTTISASVFRNWRGSGFVTQDPNAGENADWVEQSGLRRRASSTEHFDYYTRERSSQVYDSSKDAAALLSGGDLTITAVTVLNEASTIQSGGDVEINATAFDNRTLSTTRVTDARRRRAYNISDGTTIYSGSDRTCLAGDTACLSDDSTIQNLFGETTYYTNADGSLYGEARILSNGNVTINTQSGIRSDGRIQGSNVSLDGGAGGVQNGADSGSVVRFERQSTGQVDTSVSDSAVGQEVRQAAGVISGSALSSVGGSRSASVPSLADIESISPPGFQLTGLYSVTTDPNSRYLVQSRVSPGIGGLSQDYLLAQLQQTDAENVTFFADPFVEQRIVRDQLLQQTGSDVAIDEADDETDQLRRLYDNAATFANQTEGVELGQALTETQIASLDQPIVWYENQVVDGRNVLVPRVYVPTVDTLELSPAGQIVANNNLNITTEGDVTNTGGVRAGNTVSIEAENLLNETLTTVEVAQTGSGNILYRTAGPTASIEGGSVELNISSAGEDEGNLVNRGAVIRSTEGNVDIETSGDVTNEALVVEQISDVQTDAVSAFFGQQDYARRSEFVGGAIESAGDINIDAEGRVQNIASDIAGEGNVVVDGRLGVEQSNLAEVYDTSAGLGYREQAVENRSASIRGGNVTIRSDEGDIVSIGSDISANEDVFLETTNGDISLLADVQITESESLSFDDGGISYSREQSANFIGSNVSGENITLQSGGDVVGRGAQITADNDVNLEAENLDFRAAEAEVESFSFGLGLSGNAYAGVAAAGAEVGVGLNVNQTRGTQSQLAGISAGNNLSIDVDNDATLIGVNVDAGNAIEVDFGGELEIAAQQDRSVSTGFGIQGTVGVQASALPGGTGPTASLAFGASNTESIDVTQTAFSAGGDIRISGAGNARIAGVEVTAGNNAELDAGDLTVETLSDRSTTTGFGVELSTPNQLARGRAPISVGVTNESTNQIDATAGIIAGNNLDIESSGTVTNRGGRLSAEQELNIDAQNLTNESITETAVAQTGDGAVNYQTLGSTATIEGGTVNLNISSESSDEGNLVNRGGAIRSRTEALEIQTTGDIVNEALIAEQVSDVEVGNLGRLLGRQTFTKRSDFIGGTIEGATDLTLDAQGEVVNIASDIGAENDVNIIADEGFFQRNLAEAYTLEDSISLGGGSSSEGSSSASASGSTFADFQANAEASVSGSQDLISGSFRQGVENRSATVTGSNVRITSRNGDVTSIGSDITSTGETVLEATEGDINLIADAIITESSSFALSAGGSASASAGGSGLSYRADASAEGGLSLSGQSQQTANFVNSTVTGNNITLRAQNVRGVGAEVAAENNINVDVAEDVTFTAAQARVENSSFSVGVSQEVYAGAGTAEGGLGTPDGEVGTRTNFGLDVTSGFNTSTSSSGLRAGGNLNINAGGDASFIGTDLEAGQDITLDAGGDVTIAAIAEESSQTSVGISGSVGAEVGGTGAIPTGSLEAGGSTTDATRFRESRTTASGNLTIRSGGDAELVGVNLTAGGDASIEAEDVRIASAQDIVETRGGSVGLAVVNPGDILNTDESPLSVGVELSDSRAVAERSQVNTGGNLSVNARSGDAIIAGVDGNVEGNVSLTAANGESGFQELRDEVNTTSVGVDLSVSSALGSTGGGLAGIAEGTIEAIESGDGYALLNQIPGVQQVATLAAGIESGDVTQIVAGITPIGGQLLTAIDQGALGGQISENSRAQGGTEGTGAQAFLQNLQSSGNNSPAVTPLGNIVEGSSVGDIAAGADIVELDTGIDARLGVEVTTTQSDTSNGNNLQIGGNLVQEGQTVSQIGSDINVDGDATLRGGQVAIEAGVDRFSSQTTTAGVTVGFDVANQDVKVGVDGSYSTEDETTVNNSSLTAGGNLTIEASDARVASANVEAENITVDAENLEVVTLQSTRDTLSYGGAVEVEVGITGDSGAGAVEANGSETSSRTTGEQASLIARNNLDVDVDERLTLRSAQLGAEGTTTITADVIDARANTDTNDSFGFDVAVEVSANQQGEGQSGGSGSVDFAFEQSNQRGPAALSEIFGNNVDIDARDVLLEDTQVNGNTVALDVEEDLTIRTTATQASNVGVDFEVSAGGQSSGSEGGARGGASLGFGLDVGDSTTFGQQAGINAGNLTLNTGGDVALNNAEINANDAAIAIGGDLTVASQQSTSNSVTVDLDLDPAANAQAASSAVTAGADLGVGFSSENSAQVDRPSGIQIANTLDLTVGSDVALTAAEISGDAVNATIGGDVTTASVSNSSNLIAANVGTSGVGFENESSQSVTTSGITARSGQLNVTTNEAAATVAQSGDQVIETVPGTSLAQNESGVVSQTAQTSTQTEVEAAPPVDPQVALANSRADGLVRLISQAPPAVRQNAVRQIAEQLAQSPDLTNAAMLDGLNPTQKIEVLESALDVASDNDREVIEQAIELLRVDELILGANI